MSRFITVLFVSFLFLAREGRADSVIVSFPAALAGEASTGFGTSSGGSLSGNLVRIGAFDTNPTSLMAGVAALTTPSAVLSNLHARFTQYTSFSFRNDYLNPDTAIFPATDGDGIPLEAQPAIGTSLRGKDIYLLFYNTATANAATEVAIFRMKQDSLLDDPSGSTGVFNTGVGGDGQRNTTFNLSVVDTDLLLGFYNSQTDTFQTADLNGGLIRITGALTRTSLAGSASSYQIQANNGPDRYFATTNTGSTNLTETALPEGFSVATNTGVISVATNATAGTYAIRLVASNSLTASVATNTLTWVLQAATLSFTTTTNLISATAGVEISPFTFVSTGTAPSYSLASGDLRGLSLSSGGVLSGIPNSTGTNNVRIQSSAGGQSAATTFSLAVAAPTISVPADQLSGGQLVATSGIARTIVLSNTAGFANLSGLISPERTGVSFNGTNLIIATNAQPLAKGTTNVTLTLTASRGPVSASTTVPLRIVAPTPTTLVGTNAFEVDVGQAFSTNIRTDAGSYARMSFSNLPSGLVGFQNGTIAGANNSISLPFEFPVTVRADSTINYEGGGVFTSTITFRLRNTNAPYFTSTTNRHLLRVGRAISPITLVASNFPFQYSASNLPSGLQLVGANIGGTPTTAGTYTVLVTAINSYRPGSTNPADWQTGTATMIFEIAAQNRSSFSFAGSLSNAIGTNPLNGSNLVYTMDRRGVSSQAVQVGNGQGLFRTNAATDLATKHTVAFWFRMPEGEIPAEGWWLFSSGTFGIRLLPDSAGTKVEIQGIKDQYPGGGTNAIQDVIASWVPGSGWHHLCVRSAGDEPFGGLRIFYDGAETRPSAYSAYFSSFGEIDLNNFNLGANPGSSVGTAFPGSFDDFVVYDFPLGIFEPVELNFPGNEEQGYTYQDVYEEPTVAELFLGTALLNPTHQFYSLFIDSSPYGFSPHLTSGPYQGVEFQSLLGLTALQDNGDLTIFGSSVGSDFRGDPAESSFDPGPPDGGWYGRKACDPRLLYGNAQVAAGFSHLLVLKTNGMVWEQRFAGQNFSNPSFQNPTPRASNAIVVAAGWNLGMALLQSGTVQVWHPFPEGTEGLPPSLFRPGRSLEYGQTNVPAAATNCVAIAAGEEHCLALTAEGKVLAWGDNSSGQTNVPVAAQSGVVKITAGPFSSMALKEDGTIITWGDQRTASQNPPEAWQGRYRDIVAGRGMMGAITDLGRPVIWRHGPETGWGIETANEIRINDQSVQVLSGILPPQVSKLLMGEYNMFFGIGSFLDYETKPSVPRWQLSIPRQVVIPAGNVGQVDLRGMVASTHVASMRFEAFGLPEGAALDGFTGILSVSNLPVAPRFVQLLVRSSEGIDRRIVSLQAGSPGLGLFPLPVTEGDGPLKLADLTLPSGWTSPTPLDPMRYEVRSVGGRIEIWSLASLDYENSQDRALILTVSALNGEGAVQTASGTVRLLNDSSEDQDHDGLLEIYEQYYGSSDASADSDGDGFGDLVEVQQRTSPSDAAAFPGARLASVLSSNNGSAFGFKILAPIGKTLYLESSADLVSWSPETFPSGDLSLQGDGKIHHVEKPFQGNKKFYRTSSRDVENRLPVQ